MYAEIRTLRGGRGAVVIERAGQACHGVDRVLEDVAGLRSDHFVLIAVAALMFPSGDGGAPMRSAIARAIVTRSRAIYHTYTGPVIYMHVEVRTGCVDC
jgi:hypothetical protein